jgi:hypothetical protein
MIVATPTLFEKVIKRRPPRQSKTDNSELTRDLQRLHKWLQHKGGIVALRDVCHGGPPSLRDRKKALMLCECLAGNGWLVPERAHRYDRYMWRVVRGHGSYPTIATMATAASVMDAHS